MSLTPAAKPAPLATMRLVLGSLVLAAACGGSSRSAAIGNGGTAVGPVGPAPTIGWTADDGTDWGGDFTVTGMPALAADGGSVLIAMTGEDGARGAPNLALEVRGRDDRATATRVVLTADQAVGDEAQEPQPPHPDIDGANAWIAAQHARAGFAPLTEATVTQDGDGFLDSSQWQVEVGAIARRFDASANLVVTDGGKPVVERSMDAWLVKPYAPYDGAGPDEQCDNPIALRAAYVDPAHRVAVLLVAYRGTNTCWKPDSQYHVVAW